LKTNLKDSTRWRWPITGERFGYYTMLAIFVLFLQANFGWGEGLAGTVYATFLMLVYFLPIVGGAVADRIGYGRCVTIGILVMFLGYLLLAVPAGAGAAAIVIMATALLMISIGTSLFKGNLQVMVGKLYDDPQYTSPARCRLLHLLYGHQHRRPLRSDSRHQAPCVGHELAGSL